MWWHCPTCNVPQYIWRLLPTRCVSNSCQQWMYAWPSECDMYWTADYPPSVTWRSHKEVVGGRVKQFPVWNIRSFEKPIADRILYWQMCNKKWDVQAVHECANKFEKEYARGTIQQRNKEYYADARGLNPLKAILNLERVMKMGKKTEARGLFP